jgi:transposase
MHFPDEQKTGDLPVLATLRYLLQNRAVNCTVSNSIALCLMDHGSEKGRDGVICGAFFRTDILTRGFHVLKWRWVVERTNAWITHHRRLSRDFEGTHSSSEAFIYLAMTRIMLARLARACP